VRLSSGAGSAPAPASAATAAARPRSRARDAAAVIRCTETQAAVETATAPVVADTFVPVLSAAELPIGERMVVDVEDFSVMLFWYRKELFAIESRSPAEGAYSEGFISARLTQDGCVECPATDSLFDLKTGEIREWYPTNPVLRGLTPQSTCRPLLVFPVKIANDVISVDTTNNNLKNLDLDAYIANTKGGSDSSAEGNNVYSIEPTMYIEGQGEVDDSTFTGKARKIEPATIVVGTLGVAIVAVAGTGAAIYYESIVGLALFWLVGFGLAAGAVLNYTADEE